MAIENAEIGEGVGERDEAKPGILVAINREVPDPGCVYIRSEDGVDYGNNLCMEGYNVGYIIFEEKIQAGKVREFRGLECFTLNVKG